MTRAGPELNIRSNDATWNRDLWEQLPDDGKRYEVIDGYLYTSPTPSYFHQWVVVQLLILVGQPLEKRNIGYPGFARVSVFMPACDPVQPDFFVVRVERTSLFQDGYVIGSPDLIVEVLSPTTSSLDTSIKRRAYARAGVPEYWIVRPATRDVLVCWQPDASTSNFEQERRFATDDELRSTTLPVHFPVSDLFAGSPDTTL